MTSKTNSKSHSHAALYVRTKCTSIFFFFWEGNVILVRQEQITGVSLGPFYAWQEFFFFGSIHIIYMVIFTATSGGATLRQRGPWSPQIFEKDWVDILFFFFFFWQSHKKENTKDLRDSAFRLHLRVETKRKFH